MSSKRTHAFMTLTIIFSLFGALIPAASVAAGPAITTTTTALVNTILNGKTPPTASTGKNGDFYIDVKNLMFYGPKKNGVWPLGISMKGVDGKAGVDGKNGSDGATVTKSVTGATGPKGDTGATGPIGPAGPKGDTGATGLTGATGPIGLTGATGAKGDKGETGAIGLTGAKGDTGATGPKGDQGIQGDKGDQGEPGLKGDTGSTGAQGPIGLTGSPGAKGDTGATGAKGDTGATGATGPSRSFYGTASFNTSIPKDSGASGSSNAFGNFDAGKSYVIRLILVGIYTNSADEFNWQLSVSASGASAPVSTLYSMANVKSYRSSVSTREINIQADILVDGSSAANAYNLIATVQHDLGGYGVVSFSGSYIATQVGSAN